MSEPVSVSARRFGGISRLYGNEALQRFAAAHVCVVGVGGVGSWAVSFGTLGHRPFNLN